MYNDGNFCKINVSRNKEICIVIVICGHLPLSTCQIVVTYNIGMRRCTECEQFMFLRTT